MQKKSSSPKFIYGLLVFYIYYVFWQIPLKKLLEIQSIELLDEIFMLILFLYLIWRKRDYSEIDWILLGYILLLGLYLSVNPLFTNNHLLVSWVSIRDLGVLGFLFFIAGKDLIGREHRGKLVRHLWILLAVEILYLVPVQLPKVLTSDAEDQLKGTFGPGGAHTLAVFFSFFIVYLLLDLFMGKRRYWFLVPVIMLLFLFYAASFRTLILGLPLVLGVVLLIWVHCRRTFSGLKKVVLSGGILILMIGSVYQHSIIQFFKIPYRHNLNVKRLVSVQNHMNTRGRLPLLREGVKNMQRRAGGVFFGNGGGTFGSKTSKFFHSKSFIGQYPLRSYSRSQITVTFSELGILGFLLVFGFYGVAALHLIRIYQKRGNWHILYLVALLMILIGSGIGTMVLESEYLLITLAVFFLCFYPLEGSDQKGSVE